MRRALVLAVGKHECGGIKRSGVARLSPSKAPDILYSCGLMVCDIRVLGPL